MPGGDKTGPHSEGPMTGRRLGACAGNGLREEDLNRGDYGHGYKRRFGKGYAWAEKVQHGFSQKQRHYKDVSLQDVSEEQILRNKVLFLENKVQSLESRLATMEQLLSGFKKKVE